jgi:carbamoyl-phosphate synthase large subunit
MGFKLFATEHTADFLGEHGIKCEKVYKISSDKNPNVMELLENGKLDLIINIPTHAMTDTSKDGFIIRRKAVDMNIPLITNRQLAEAFITALDEIKKRKRDIKDW